MKLICMCDVRSRSRSREFHCVWIKWNPVGFFSSIWWRMLFICIQWFFCIIVSLFHLRNKREREKQKKTNMTLSFLYDSHNIYFFRISNSNESRLRVSLWVGRIQYDTWLRSVFLLANNLSTGWLNQLMLKTRVCRYWCRFRKSQSQCIIKIFQVDLHFCNPHLESQPHSKINDIYI